MKVKELIERLQKFDLELDIYVPGKITEHDYNYAHSVDSKFLTIEESEDYPNETLVVIIDEV